MIRLVPKLDEFEPLHRFVQTPFGKVVVCLAGGALLWPAFGRGGASIALLCLPAALSPKRRQLIVTVGTMAAVLGGGWVRWESIGRAVPTTRSIVDSQLGRLAALLGVILICAAYYELFRRSERVRKAIRWPVGFLLALIVVAFGVLAAVEVPPVFAPLAVIALVFGKYVWFLAYAIRHCQTRSPAPFHKHLAFFHPFWGSTNVPYPKGASYLWKIESVDADALARTQLKGLKLLWWSLVLRIAEQVARQLVLGAAYEGDYFSLRWSLGVPGFFDTFDAFVAGEAPGLLMTWLSTTTYFMLSMLDLAIFGHAVIGGCRLAGYAALRNTVRPLQARTITDFWNHLYFYYKELLVTFFYFPVFLAAFKRYPKLRVATATMVSCLANYLYHFLRDWELIFELGLFPAFDRCLPFMWYCVLLGIGISWSQIRRMDGKHKDAAPDSFVARFVDPTKVVLFYVVITTFSNLGRDTSVLDHAKYVLYLFGAGLVWD